MNSVRYSDLTYPDRRKQEENEISCQGRKSGRLEIDELHFHRPHGV